MESNLAYRKAEVLKELSVVQSTQRKKILEGKLNGINNLLSGLHNDMDKEQVGKSLCLTCCIKTVAYH